MDPTATTQPTAVMDESAVELPPEEPIVTVAKMTPVQVLMFVLGTIGFLYFARPVILPICLACVAGMALSPLIRWSSCCHIPPALSAAVIISLLVAMGVAGFIQF